MELEKQLVLNRYFLNLFGFRSFDEVREKLKDTKDGYDNFGRSYIVKELIKLNPKLEDLLLRYDLAIKEYVDKIKRNRLEFKLKYFQYLAVLFSEIYLDKYFNDKEFLNELNLFLEELKVKLPPFTKEDLKKLAFWMATGSGKTLILHINYLQMLKYSNKWDNIILITPNEGLSEQHYEELKSSGIACKLYDGNIDNLKTKDKEILIIDIHKLTKNKKKEGVSVDISYFDGKNLVFVDEGHKGQKSQEQKWKKIREELAKDGFMFEYSATFGQVIGNNKDLLQEYAKAIIFDYSYKYFYKDGYGKDFYVYNIQTNKEYSKEQQDLLLIAGLLSFYEQLVVFEENKEEFKRYNIEKPLWIFIGSRVIKSKTKIEKDIASDVERVIKFIDEVLSNEDKLKQSIDKILNAKTGLLDEEGRDVFEDKFRYLKEVNKNNLIDDIYQKVFGGRGKLELYEIKNADEIALKSSASKDYFGVINVGDINALKNLIDLKVKRDYFTNSLFSSINSNSSNINILIGSKKFIEGWNSWRVSNIGLINIGKNEGPQIIQLFGRGVRLKGKNYSLKREVKADYKLKILQTLFVFGLNADYMSNFLNVIESEDINYKEVKKSIEFSKLEKETKQDDFNFLNYPLKLAIDDALLKSIKLDLKTKIKIAHNLKVDEVNKTNTPLKIKEDALKFIDLDFISLEVMNYKIENAMYNLIIDADVIKEIIYSQKYKLFLDEVEGLALENNTLKITSFSGIEKLNEIVLMIVKEYIFKFYKKNEQILKKSA